MLIAHPGQGNDTLAAMQGQADPDRRRRPRRLLAVAAGEVRLHRRADPHIHVQPRAVPRRQEGDPARLSSPASPTRSRRRAFKPVVFLLADHGYPGYCDHDRDVAGRSWTRSPTLVQRFVDATIEGWNSYLYGDPAPANALIKKRQSRDDRRSDRLQHRKLKRYGIVDSRRRHDAGHRRHDRRALEDFYDTMVEAGLYPAGPRPAARPTRSSSSTRRSAHEVMPACSDSRSGDADRRADPRAAQRRQDVSRTARRRCATSISTSATASSSACSARRAAARAPCCA